MPVAIPVILAATAVAGVGAQVYGNIQQQKAAKEQNEANQRILEDQQKAEAARQQAMELDARRKQMQNLRNMNIARAAAVSNATNAGAQYGSGLQGGYGQISGDATTNAVGINQSLLTGREIFSLNSDITNARIDYGNASTLYSQGAGYASLGGNLISSMGTIGRLSGGFGSGSSGGTQSYGYNPYYGSSGSQGAVY